MSGAVSCPTDMIDQIGGWATSGVGQGYGEGFPLNLLQRYGSGQPLEVKAKWMSLLVDQD